MSYENEKFTVDPKINSNISTNDLNDNFNTDSQSNDNVNTDFQFKTDFKDPDTPFAPQPINSSSFYSLLIDFWNLSIKYMYYIIIFYIIFYSLLFYFFYDDMIFYLEKFYIFLLYTLNYIYNVTFGSIYKTFLNIYNGTNTLFNKPDNILPKQKTDKKVVIDEKLKSDINNNKQKIQNILADETDSDIQKHNKWCYIGNENGSRKCAPIHSNTCMSQHIFKNLSDCISNN
tara:strand:- start:1707 stop:2396 length:690 start_codon:yes stop_codon:yes gene_type:complete